MLPESLLGGLSESTENVRCGGTGCNSNSNSTLKKQEKSTFEAILELWDSLVLTLKVNSLMKNHCVIVAYTRQFSEL